MMNGMMGFGGLAAVLVTGLLIAAVVWGVIGLTKSEGKPVRIGLVVLAILGGGAFLAVLALSFMHSGLMGGMMGS